MPRIAPIEYETATPDERATLDWIAANYGHPTNFKRTAAHSETALRALLTWYPLHDAIQLFLGVRLTAFFAHAISSQSDCLICSTYFRRALIQAGEDPDHFTLNAREQTVVDFGRQLVKDANGVDDALYARLAKFFTPAQIVDLTAFATLMIATNIFNNTLRVDLDENLFDYRLAQVTERNHHG